MNIVKVSSPTFVQDHRSQGLRRKGQYAQNCATDAVIAYEQTLQAGLTFDVQVNLLDTDVSPHFGDSFFPGVLLKVFSQYCVFSFWNPQHCILPYLVQLCNLCSSRKYTTLLQIYCKSPYFNTIACARHERMTSVVIGESPPILMIAPLVQLLV